MFLSTPGIAWLPTVNELTDIVRAEGLKPILWSGLSTSRAGLTNSQAQEAREDLFQSHAAFVILGLATSGKVLGKECVSDSLPTAVGNGMPAFVYFFQLDRDSQLSEDLGQITIPRGTTVRFIQNLPSLYQTLRQDLRLLM